MISLAVISLTGGAGKTTVAANLACALAESRRVIALDTSPTNALGLHLGMPPGQNPGICDPALTRDMLASFLRANQAAIPYIPFGRSPAMMAQPPAEPDWLSQRLDELLPEAPDFIILDTPAHGPWLHHALAAADHALIVLEACPRSFVSISDLESLLAQYGQGGQLLGHHYVLNRFDARRALSRDIRTAMSATLGPRLLGTAIPDDEHVREALASRLPCMRFAPHSQFTATMEGLAAMLPEVLS